MQARWGGAPNRVPEGYRARELPHKNQNMSRLVILLKCYTEVQNQIVIKNNVLRVTPNLNENSQSPMARAADRIFTL